MLVFLSPFSESHPVGGKAHLRQVHLKDCIGRGALGSGVVGGWMDGKVGGKNR